MLSKSFKASKGFILVVAFLLSLLVALIVYKNGGTTKVYSYLMVIPITIVASTNGKKYGIINAIFGGFLLGPFMPLDVKANIFQEPVNWVIRMLIYMVLAFVIGFFSDYYKREFENSNKKDKELVEAQMAMIYSLVKLTESRDDTTGEHIERVSEFCRLLAEKLRKLPQYEKNITDSYIENLVNAAPLHDIGKVGIPDSILLKPGKLTKEEFEKMKTHPTIGANTLIEVKKKYPDNKFLEEGISIAHFHHEKWDGTGYPCGLSGTDIPLSARIMALADVYDALRSKRVYKEPYSHQESLDIIKNSPGHFDPVIVNVFIENEKEFENLYASNV